MARVLCITLNPALDLAFSLDQLTLGAVNRPHHAQLEAAGKGVNVARVLARLGHEVTVSGFLGADNDAPFALAFQHSALRDDFVRVAGETRINAKLAEHSGRVTDINGPGMPVTQDDLERLTVRLDTQLHSTTPPHAVVVAGSLPPGLNLDDFRTLLQHLKASGVPLWVDTSGEALNAAIEAKPTAVKPNELELAEWAGAALDTSPALTQAARRLHQSGVEHALVSAGVDGVLWVNAQGSWHSTPPTVTAVNTVCAGDTFVAAMLHGLLSGHDPEHTLRFATALSAEAVRHVGVGNPQAPDFDSLQQQTRVRRLDDTITEGATL
ncbi:MULTISPECIES: 1-phosphofructokinase [unclassified Halomonas]|uniref:1-phosphofructokinase n=1 Tax=unclassified Halomonas TaxID=2609666 RepID=UPI0006D9CFCC|nr:MULTISPECIES: 1-phosphofructokinase [unclassified Halomonas]KPQ18731.1 MAG: 1-phosphofructokinase FruK [Halomonas sp. HL-93]SBR47959.1 1-phosphofructokinase [Halomonas sp. HL-93]SNY95689.1 1-phosphofructokinase [Halomonas sp. hl-4]